MITITRAPAYLTVQDAKGRRARASGVPGGGAMDSFALAAANILVGNDPNAAGLEWALSAGSIRIDDDCALAIGGAATDVMLNDEPVPLLTTIRARGGDALTVGRFRTGRFLYLAFAGGVNVPLVLGSSGTYLPAKFGGFEGRMLKTGDRLSFLQTGKPTEPRSWPPALVPEYSHERIRVTRAPQADLFDAAAWQAFLVGEFRVSHSSDRTGYRLEGTRIPQEAATLPSEASCPGAIQIPADGNPIVLMADAPTIGGYPKIACVAEVDLPVFAQRPPDARVRFELITLEESQGLLKRRAADLALLADGSRS